MTEKEKVAEETAAIVDAHCLAYVKIPPWLGHDKKICGKQLILKGAYFECPDHCKKWFP